MDEQLLISLGLNTREAKVYKAVLRARELDPARLAKATGIKRTTAYSIARSLIEKGLLIEDSSRRPRVFRPAATEDLALAVETERKRSEERQQLLKKLAEEVSMVNAETTYPVPRIKFTEESKLEAYFPQVFPIWMESMIETKEYGFWGYQDATLVEAYEDQLHYWWSIAPPELYVKLLTNLSSAERRMMGKYERRDMKYWGEATNFISSTWICGDYVIMINTRQHPHYMVEIHSRLLAHDQREVFRNLWDLV
ncbi:MAG TPA: helix-turn-helix domain-containing protein [Candidatus Paceibacterota bacterium]|nr:helix-turn-helix domain-containing protein [Candidatus Paceibacterota bacterium]